MNRRELKIEIQEFIKSLPKEQRYCNGCSVLRNNKSSGAKGQVVTAFNDGIHICDEWQVMWAYRLGQKADRPIECMIDGEKYSN